MDELRAFASGCDILVCLLPLTADTEGILNTELLSWLPQGASVINGARGSSIYLLTCKSSICCKMIDKPARMT